MKSKELKVYNLPQDNFMISCIDAKPKGLMVFIFLLGVISIALEMPNVLSIFLMIASISWYSLTPSVILIEFYNEYLVLKNKADKSMCVLIYYEDIASWYYSWTASNDELVIELTDGTIEKVKAFSKTLFESQMSRFLKYKKKKTK